MNQKLTFAEYQKIDALSRSELVEFAFKGVRHALKAKAAPEQSYEALTASQRLGVAFHSSVLEPELFKTQFKEIKHRRNTTLYKMWKAENPGVNELSEAEYETVCKMRDAVLKRFPVFQDVSYLLTEVTLTGEIEGVNCKARLDASSKGLGMVPKIWDLKSTNSIDYDSISRQISQGKYDIQAAFYKELFENVNCRNLDAFCFIFAETSEPFGVREVYIGDETLSLARSEILQMIQNYRQMKDCGFQEQDELPYIWQRNYNYRFELY